MDGGTIFTLIFVVFIVVCFIKAVNTVNQGFEYTEKIALTTPPVNIKKVS